MLGLLIAYLVFVVFVAGLGGLCNAQSIADSPTLVRLGSALDSNQVSISDALTDSTLMRFHSDPRFREAIRSHATTGPCTLVSSREPGRPLRVTGVIRDKKGKPVGGALIYVYQTDSTGRYTKDRATDEPHARLFAYLRSG